MPSFIKEYDNVVSFHGSDHKSGVTMLSLSVCYDICRKNPDFEHNVYRHERPSEL